MGERTCHIDPNVKGGFLRVSLINNQEDFIRNILEGLPFSLKNCLDIIEEMDVKVEGISKWWWSRKQSLDTEILQIFLITLNNS